MTTTTLPPRGISAADALDGCVEAVRALSGVNPAMLEPGELGRLLVGLEQAIDAARGVAASWSAAFAEQRGFEAAGASSMAGWMRQELRLTAGETRRRGRAAAALDALPQTRAALAAGEVGAAHVDVLADGVHALGAVVMRGFEPVLLDVARACDADALRRAVRTVRDGLDPDAADAAYVRALERRDVAVTPVGEGFALSGFLDPETGVALKEILYSGAKPTSPDDARTAGQRRVDALRELCTAALAHGLPSDRGIRPQLFVTVDALRLASAVNQSRPPAQRGHPAGPGQPATLHGFGEISDALLSKLACDSAITPVIVDGRSPCPSVLDVGRTSRLATLKQRQAILVQQGGTCFAPGCDNTHLEFHHMVPWLAGGETNLANLRGYCTRCHHLIHQGKLVTRSNRSPGWRHYRRSGEPLVDHRRRTAAATRVFLDATLAGGITHAREQLQIWRRGGT